MIYSDSTHEDQEHELFLQDPLQENYENILSNSLEEILEGYLVLDHTQKILYINSRARQILHIFSLAKGKCFADIIPDSFKSLSSAVEMVLDQHISHTWIDRDEVLKENFIANIHPTRYGASVLIQNKHYDAHTDIHISHLTSIVQHSPDAIFTKDMNTVITSWNPGAERMYGYTPKEIIGKSVHTLCPDELRGEIEELMDRLGRGEYIENLHTIRKRKDGSLIEISLTLSPLFDGCGRVVGGSVMAKDLSEQKRSEERFYKLAYYDQLTGLPNRTLFQELVKRELQESSKKKSQCAVMFIDIDDFKDINDTLGHDMGDKLLRVVADRLRKCIRKKDIVARQGGDEFTLILPGVKEKQSPTHIAQRIIKEISNPIQIDGHEISVTPSIGIALFPENAKNAQDLTMYADSAMYIAKRKGGNTFEFYEREFFNKSMEKLSIEHNLRNAIKNNEFSIAYQMQYDLRENQVFAVEALLRWDNPNIGIVAPAKFIPVAQRIGLMGDILEWTLEEVCQQVPILQKHHIRATINISTHQLTADFIQYLRSLMKRCNIDTKMVEFEIRETDDITDITYTKKVLEEMKKMGINLSIDDFGIGYSSLSYLYLLPISRIKIDRSFIHNISASTKNLKIVKAIIAMAHQLDMQVIAEGVETAEEMELLKCYGCDYAQGFFISRPQPIKKILSQLKG